MALKPNAHPSATRHKRGSNLRAEPQGPLGHLIQNAIDRKHLSRPRAAKFLNAAIKRDTGEAAGITHSSLRNWISRWVIPRPDTQRALMAVLDIPERTLTKAINAQRVARDEIRAAEKAARMAVTQRARKQRVAPAPQQAAPAAAAWVALPAPIELASALLLSADLSGAGPAGPGLALEPVDSDDMRRRQAVKLLLAAGAASGGLDLERLASILAGTRADAPGLDDLEALTGDLIRREATLAPHALLPAVRGHLQGLHETLVWTPSSLASRAYSLAGQTALLAGYLSFKQDQRAQADVYYTLADRYGEVAGDVRLRAAVLLLRGWRWHEENPSHAIAMLDRAESILGPRPDPTAAATILGWRGFVHANAIQIDHTHNQYAMRDVQDAQGHADRLRPASNRFYIFESAEGEATAMRTLTLLHLNRPKEAVDEIDRLLTSIAPESLSWRSFTMTNLATAHADMGDPEHAFELLMEALRLGASASAPLCIRKIRVQRQQWPSLAKYDAPAARRLDEQLRVLAAPTTPLGAGGFGTQ